MKFFVEIAMDNDAFNDGTEGTHEVARILRKLADELVAAEMFSTKHTGSLRDINGNTVGLWVAEEPEPYADD